MRHPIFSFLTTTTIAMPASSSTTKPRKPSATSAASAASANHHHHYSSPLLCRNHSPSPSATATLDLLILILVLFSGTFLLTSYFSYIFNSLSLLLSHSSLLHHHFPAVYLAGFLFSFAAAASAFACSRRRSRRCENPKCKGLKKAMEFDLQLQTEDCLKSNPNYEIDRLPWKGGNEMNPDYECLRAELRKMAPPNGRAVLLFRAKCGCPVAKLVGSGPKKGRKHKKSLPYVATNGDHR